jgi:large subunit ribosomal protein L15
MELNPTTIKPAQGSNKRKAKRGGRGNASGKGTTAGRGGKGQTARSGGAHRTQMRGMRHNILKIPKVRGFQSMHDKKETVTLRDLDRVALENKEITPAYLKAMGVVGNPEKGVKIVASGNVTKKLTISGCLASKKVIELVEKAGGTIKF